MKKPPLLYFTLTSIALVSFSSCSLDPNYREYKQQQAANAATTATNNANPYGVPQASSAVSSYAPAPAPNGEAPYQPIPGVTSTPSTYTPVTPAVVTPNKTITGNSYLVSPGDSLWKISREFGTTVEEIQAANGLTNTTIRSGQKLIIPGR